MLFSDANIRKSLFAFILALVPIGITFGAPHNAHGATSKSMLCDDAAPGVVEPLPPLVKNWVVVLCTPSGQALGPFVDKEVVLWLNKSNGRPFIAQAYPLNAPLPGNLTSDDIRFRTFLAREMEGKTKEMALKLWENAFEQAKDQSIERVVQLDAISVYNNITFNFFFYLRKNEPRWILVCLNRCKISVSLDILTGEELKSAVRK